MSSMSKVTCQKEGSHEDKRPRLVPAAILNPEGVLGNRLTLPHSSPSDEVGMRLRQRSHWSAQKSLLALGA